MFFSEFLYEFFKAIQRGPISIKNMNWTFNPAIVDFAIAYTVNPKDDSDWKISGYMKTLRPFKSAFLQVQSFLTSRGSQWRDRKAKFVDHNIDLCDFFKRSHAGDISAAFVLSMFKRFGEIPSKCPIDGTLFAVNNLTVVGMRIPYLHYLPLQFEGATFTKFFTKELGRTVKVATIDFYGVYRNS